MTKEEAEAHTLGKLTVITDVIAIVQKMKNTKTSLDDNDWNNRNIGYNQALNDLIYGQEFNDLVKKII